MDGSQTIAWVERRVGALTEAKIEARQSTMRLDVEAARDRLQHDLILKTDKTMFAYAVTGRPV